MDFFPLFQKFERALLEKGYFVYMPEVDWQGIKDNLVQRIYFGSGGTTLYRVPYSLAIVLKEVQEQPRRMPEPDLTDYHQWKVLAAHYFLLRSQRRPFLLPDGSVAKVHTVTIDIIAPWNEQPDPRWMRWGDRNEGQIVVLGHRYFMAHVRNLRRQLEDALRKDPSLVVRVVELLNQQARER